MPPLQMTDKSSPIWASMPSKKESNYNFSFCGNFSSHADEEHIYDAKFLEKDYEMIYPKFLL